MSTGRDTRSRSLQRMVRPLWLTRCDEISAQLQMLEKTRRQGTWGIMVLRDREALVWQNGHREIFFLFRGLRFVAAAQSDESSRRDASLHEKASAAEQASEQKP